jgi:hypothetical protein
MKHSLNPNLVLAFSLALAVALTCANDSLSPQQRLILESKSSSPIAGDVQASMRRPGPQFTDVEKEIQREHANGVMPVVKKAFESGAEEVRIPPGDYRFGQERYEGAKVIYPLGFVNMQRDAEHPFVIDATAATFWFDLDDKQMPPGTPLRGISELPEHRAARRNHRSWDSWLHRGAHHAHRPRGQSF